MTASRHYRLGVFWSLLSAFLWGTTYVVCRFLMRGEEPMVDPVTLTLLRFGLGGLLLLPAALGGNSRAVFRQLTLRDYGRIYLLSLLAVVGMGVFLFWGQRYTSAINAAIIISAAPVFTLLLRTLGGARAAPRQLACMAAAGAGALLVIGAGGDGGLELGGAAMKGNLLVLVAALSWALSTLYAKKIITPRNDLAVTVLSMFFAAGTLLLVNLFRGDAVLLPQNLLTWGMVLYLAVFSTALGFYAWNAALGRIELELANIMQYLTPLVTMTLAWLFLHESANPGRWLGALLVIGGVALSSDAVKNRLTRRR